jgi:hypothetical protein
MKGPLSSLGTRPGSVYPFPVGNFPEDLVPSLGLGIRVGSSAPAESPNNITLPMNIIHIFIKPATEKEY